MDKGQLAEDLRERLVRSGQVVAEVLSADDVIEYSVTCGGCGQQWIDSDDLDWCIAEAGDTDHYLGLTAVRRCDVLRAHLVRFDARVGV